MVFNRNLIVHSKLDYVRGHRPEVDCILCAVNDDDDKVKKYVLYKNKLFVVSLNLYPYTIGHLLIFPKRHIEKYQDLTYEENNELFDLTKICMDILIKKYNSPGFNIGWNLGPTSGASIPHVHKHIVPRYNNEIGFMEIISGTRCIVDDPQKIFGVLKEEFDKL